VLIIHDVCRRVKTFNDANPRRKTDASESIPNPLLLYIRLSALDNRKTIVVKLISLLLRSGAGPAARSTLLAARSEVTKKRVRMIRFEGAVEQYINDLAVVFLLNQAHCRLVLASLKRMIWRAVRPEIVPCSVES